MSTIAALTICNEALLALGEQPLDDFEADSAAASVARLRYQTIVDELLGGHPWQFNRRIARLAALTDPPPLAAGFSAAYQLPPLCFRIICAFIGGGRVTEWRQAEGVLWIDAGLSDTVELEYHSRADESAWKPGFRQAVISRLAAEFCIPVTDDTVRAKLLFELAEMQLRQARHLNATEQPAQRLPTGRWAARRSW